MAALTTTRQAIREKAMKAIGALYLLTCDGASAGTTITATGIKDIAVDDERFAYAYLYDRTQDEFRLVTSTDVSAGTLTIQRAFTADANTNVLELILIISFDEANDAINDGLEDKFY